MNKTKGLFFTASLVLALTLTQSCSGDDGGGKEEGGQEGIIQGTPITYEGETYPTVIIGSQTWFAKNLNYDVQGSKCYDDDPANCTQYGRLYDWATAMGFSSNCNSAFCLSQIQSPHRGICPSGWHIPSYNDWDILIIYSGHESTAGAKLKSTSGWNSHNAASGSTDQYGFSALPGGGYLSGGFGNVGDFGHWWSASENENSNNRAYRQNMSYISDMADLGANDKSNLLSIRCIKD